MQTNQQNSLSASQRCPKSPPLFRSHPLFVFRAILVIDDVLGFLMSLVTLLSNDNSMQFWWACGALQLVISALLSCIDVFIWMDRKKEQQDNRNLEDARSQASICIRCQGSVANNEQCDALDVNNPGNGDELKSKPIWPIRWLMIFEFFFAGACFWLWIFELAGAVALCWGYCGNSVLSAYATIPMFVAALVHMLCWWKQFREREKQRWKKEHNHENSRANSGVSEVGGAARANKSLTRARLNGDIGILGQQLGALVKQLGVIERPLRNVAEYVVQDDTAPLLACVLDDTDNEIAGRQCPHSASAAHQHGKLATQCTLKGHERYGTLESAENGNNSLGGELCS